MNNEVLIINPKHGEPKNVEQIGTKGQLYGDRYTTILIYGDINQDFLDRMVATRAIKLIVFMDEDGTLRETWEV